MKKILAISLIGLLSLLIQATAMAEKESTENTTMSQTESSTETTATEESAEESKETEATEEAEDAEATEDDKDQAAVLGDSIDVYSLRGDNDIDAASEAFPNHRTMVVDGGIDVTFGDQPPMVPHSIDKDRISLQENTCLKCHSKADSKLESAPKPTPSHFKGRDGKKKSKIVAGRYFCTQCHTPQANTKPLIKNNFKD